MCFLCAGGPGSEDHASHEDLPDLKAGSSLDGAPSLWLYSETVLPAGPTPLRTITWNRWGFLQMFDFHLSSDGENPKFYFVNIQHIPVNIVLPTWWSSLYTKYQKTMSFQCSFWHKVSVSTVVFNTLLSSLCEQNVFFFLMPRTLKGPWSKSRSLNRVQFKDADPSQNIWRTLIQVQAVKGHWTESKRLEGHWSVSVTEPGFCTCHFIQPSSPRTWSYHHRASQWLQVDRLLWLVNVPSEVFFRFPFGAGHRLKASSTHPS